MSLLRWTPVPDGRRRAPGELGYAYRVVDQGAGSGGSTGSPVRPGAGSRSTDGDCASSTPAPATIPVERSGHVPVPYADRLTPTRGFAAAAAPAAPRPRTAHPVPQAPVVAAPAAPRAPAAAGGDDVLAVVTGIVAEMTGYPADLLDPDLDLEADLGVDTVKQAEVFAAVREHWSLERDDTVRLRDFPTLNHVAGWVRGKLGVTAVTSLASASPVLSPSPRPFGDGRRPDPGDGHPDRRRDDRLPRRPPRCGPRPRGRPRRRHRQAGRGLRRRPRPVGPRARRRRAAARLPHPEPRRGLGPRPARRARPRRWFRYCVATSAPSAPAPAASAAAPLPPPPRHLPATPSSTPSPASSPR